LSAHRERERERERETHTHTHTHTHSAETIDSLAETDHERLASAGEVGSGTQAPSEDSFKAAAAACADLQG